MMSRRPASMSSTASGRARAAGTIHSSPSPSNASKRALKSSRTTRERAWISPIACFSFSRSRRRASAHPPWRSPAAPGPRGAPSDAWDVVSPRSTALHSSNWSKTRTASRPSMRYPALVPAPGDGVAGPCRRAPRAPAALDAFGPPFRMLNSSVPALPSFDGGASPGAASGGEEPPPPARARGEGVSSTQRTAFLAFLGGSGGSPSGRGATATEGASAPPAMTPPGVGGRGSPGAGAGTGAGVGAGAGAAGGDAAPPAPAPAPASRPSPRGEAPAASSFRGAGRLTFGVGVVCSVVAGFWPPDGDGRGAARGPPPELAWAPGNPKKVSFSTRAFALPPSPSWGVSGGEEDLQGGGGGEGTSVAAQRACGASRAREVRCLRLAGALVFSRIRSQIGVICIEKIVSSAAAEQARQCPSAVRGG